MFKNITIHTNNTSYKHFIAFGGGSYSIDNEKPKRKLKTVAKLVVLNIYLHQTNLIDLKSYQEKH